MFQNKKIAYCHCPACNTESRLYFGDVLGVRGCTEVAEVKWSNPKCKVIFNLQKSSLRANTVGNTGQLKKIVQK